MQLTAFSMMTYEQTRKAKMYQINMRTVRPDYLTVLDYLKGIHVHTIQIRLFYTRFTEDTTTDLLANYPEKHIQAILMYSLINNVSLVIKTLYCDANNYIFDILCSNNEQTVKALIRDLLRHNSCFFASKVEIKTIGDILAQELSKGMKPVYIGEYRIHHYLLALGALFTDDEFLQGVFLGAGLEDLPDLINDLHPDLKNLANNLRKFQGKTPQ